MTTPILQIQIVKLKKENGRRDFREIYFLQCYQGEFYWRFNLKGISISTPFEIHSVPLWNTLAVDLCGEGGVIRCSRHAIWTSTSCVREHNSTFSLIDSILLLRAGHRVYIYLYRCHPYNTSPLLCIANHLFHKTSPNSSLSLP